MNHADPNRQHFNVTLAVLAMAGISFALLQSLVAPALPVIQQSLNTSETAVGWILTAYLLSASVATPIVGRLGDMFGKERLLVITLTLLTAGTLLAAVANSIEVLILARVIQGLGGGIFPLAFGIIRDEFPRERVAGGIGLMSALVGIGGGLGVVLAGVIVDNLNYHYLFWFPLVVIGAATIAAYFFVPESPIKSPGKINWLGAFLMSIGISAVLIAISEGASWGWGSSRTIGLFAAGCVMIAAWIAAELRSESPLVDMKMMEIKGVWTTNTVAFLLGAGMFSSFLLVPQLVQLPESTGFGLGASVTQAGLYLLPSTVMMLAVGACAGRIEARFGSKPPLLAGLGFAAAAFLLLAIAHGQPIDIYIATTLLGIGIGLAFAAMANLIVTSVGQEQTGVATGMNTVMRSLGGAVGAQIAASFLTNSVSVDGLPTDAGFTGAFIFCVVALVIGIGAGTLIPGRKPAEELAAMQPAADAT
ncbi:MAG: MFS transporter [Solirubrobacterales bacterium]